MIIDELLEICDNTLLDTGAVATYNIGDVFDTRSATTDPNVLKDLGMGTDLWCIMRMTVSAAGASAVGQFRLVSDDIAVPNTSTATVHFTSAAIPMASLTAGTTIAAFKLPSGNYERYVGVQQITSGAAFSAGRVDVFLTNDPNAWRAYGDAVN